MAQMWIGFFWQRLAAAFSPLAMIGYFASILFVLRLPLPKRTWVYFLHIAFLLAAFLQPLTANSKIDIGEWWTQMPYHTYTNLIYALLAGLGTGLLIEKLTRKRAYAFWLAPALLLIPFFTFHGSEPSSSQRGRWFGWMYGHDMLKDLPRNSIVIGGTDAGRFVPTYMIFGESPQPAKFKRDPSFDRRDLYIITQNALGEPNYMKYLRDQYTTARPQPKNAFERWLGRGEAYPQNPIQLPSEKEIAEAVKETLEKGDVRASPGDERGVVVFSSVLKWIWEKNRDQHDFFIEESFPIEWTYDYAIPHGLVYQINKTKLDTLPKDAVEEDFRFWKEYKTRLLNDPEYHNDFDAQRSFSKLRQTIGNIYRHRKMSAEAERAYLESLELWPNNIEVILVLMNYQWERGDFDTPIQLFRHALDNDPNNFSLWRLIGLAMKRKETQGEIAELTRKLEEQPKSRETLHRLIEIYANVGDTNNGTPMARRALKDFPEDTDMLRFVIQYYEQNNELAETFDAAKRLTEVESSNLDNYLILSRALFYRNKKKEFYKAAEKAVELGGNEVREGFRNEPMFSPWTNDPEFKKLTDIPPLPTK
jgi:tetratricopeptide (TPR) repeat protein